MRSKCGRLALRACELRKLANSIDFGFLHVLCPKYIIFFWNLRNGRKEKNSVEIFTILEISRLSNNNVCGEHEIRFSIVYKITEMMTWQLLSNTNSRSDCKETWDLVFSRLAIHKNDKDFNQWRHLIVTHWTFQTT